MQFAVPSESHNIWPSNGGSWWLLLNRDFGEFIRCDTINSLRAKSHHQPRVWWGRDISHCQHFTVDGGGEREDNGRAKCNFWEM